MHLLVGEASLIPEAERLADLHALDLERTICEDWRRLKPAHAMFLLLPQGLSLVVAGAPRMRPLLVDFTEPGTAGRLARAGIRSEALARAVGLTANARLRIVDATAGLGRDAAVFAALGCPVLMFERNPLLGMLLCDGLKRGRRALDRKLADMAAKMCLVVADARSQLATLPEEPEYSTVITLDPMFDDGRGSALPKREMRYLQSLGLDDADAAELLEIALGCTYARRVVVKRPLRAAPLGQRPPQHAIHGSSTRFDVYIR